ncbi:MAG: hypothetical protein WD708_07935 [Kiritimatiellia bacterium]
MNNIKQFILALILVSPALLRAHPGHPGPAEHSDITHLVVGLAISLPALLGFILWLRHHKAATVKRSKK